MMNKTIPQKKILLARIQYHFMILSEYKKSNLIQSYMYELKD